MDVAPVDAPAVEAAAEKDRNLLLDLPGGWNNLTATSILFSLFDNLWSTLYTMRLTRARPLDATGNTLEWRSILRRPARRKQCGRLVRQQRWARPASGLCLERYRTTGSQCRTTSDERYTRSSGSSESHQRPVVIAPRRSAGILSAPCRGVGRTHVVNEISHSLPSITRIAGFGGKRNGLRRNNTYIRKGLNPCGVDLAGRKGPYTKSSEAPTFAAVK